MKKGETEKGGEVEKHKITRKNAAGKNPPAATYSELFGWREMAFQ